MTKQEQLQALANYYRTDNDHEFFIEYRPGHGWFAVAAESRWIGDDGAYLGRDFQEAQHGLMMILG